VELTTAARLGQLILERRPDPILLLGAGASLKSGVPLAGDIAELAARHAYCRELGFDENDQSVRRSDWHAWLTNRPWFDASVPITDQYASVVQRLLQPRAERREFFLRVISPTVPRSPGYDALAELLETPAAAGVSGNGGVDVGVQLRVVGVDELLMDDCVVDAFAGGDHAGV
jgi:hypothetical protein